MKLRKVEEHVFLFLMRLSALLIGFALLAIIWSIFSNGLGSLNWQMISEVPKGGYYFGKEGGILNAIIGSLYLSLGATVLALVIGLPIALFINIHLSKRRRLVNVVRLILDILWGVPSIVYGAFGFTVMIFFGVKTSLMAGIIVITALILPIMIRSLDEVFKEVPMGLKEASYSLGSTKSETAYKVYVRQCVPGLVTAVLLSLGRGIGDAASVLFTSGYTDNIPTALDQPAATLPLAIFFQLGSPIPEVQNRAYAAAAVLTIIILVISILARIVGNKYQKNKIKA